MSKGFIVWEHPRARGTAISYGFYNGLKQQGLKVTFDDEPSERIRVTKILESEGLEAVQKHHAFYTNLSGRTENYIVQKRQARSLFDDRCHFNNFGDSWLGDFQHVLLIRNPEESIASQVQAHKKIVAKKPGSTRPRLSVERVGLYALSLLFNKLNTASDSKPLVIDTNELTADPENGMRALAQALDVPFHQGMIKWSGVDYRNSWGATGCYYETFKASGGVLPYKAKPIALDDVDREIVAACQPYYEELYEKRLKVLEPQGAL